MHVRQLIVFLAIGLATAAAADDHRTERRTFSLPQTEALGIPISDAVLVGDTLYLSGNGGIDLSLYGQFNEVYRSYFDGDYPARVGSGKLLFGMRFEIQAIAVK